jgi:hypothetical protein
VFGGAFVVFLLPGTPALLRSILFEVIDEEAVEERHCECKDAQATQHNRTVIEFNHLILLICYIGPG